MQDYIAQLLQDQGVPQDLDPEVRQQLEQDMTERATNFLNRRLLDEMSDEAVEHFQALINEEPLDPQRIQDFITTNVPDRENIAAKALLEFRALYLGDKA